MAQGLGFGLFVDNGGLVRVCTIKLPERPQRAMKVESVDCLRSLHARTGGDQFITRYHMLLCGSRPRSSPVYPGA